MLVEDAVIISVYLVVFFALCATIHYRDEDDAAYFFAVMWPLMLMCLPFFAVGYAGVKLGEVIKRRRRDC